MITYLTQPYLIRRDNCRPYGQSQSGYSNKIATTQLIQLLTSKRWYRVYVTLCGNVGVEFVIIGKKRFYLKGK